MGISKGLGCDIRVWGAISFNAFHYGLDLISLSLIYDCSWHIFHFYVNLDKNDGSRKFFFLGFLVGRIICGIIFQTFCLVYVERRMHNNDIVKFLFPNYITALYICRRHNILPSHSLDVSGRTKQQQQIEFTKCGVGANVPCIPWLKLIDLSRSECSFSQLVKSHDISM